MGESADQARVMARGLGAARVYIVPFDVAADLLVDSKPLLCASPVRCLDIRRAALPLHAEGASLCVDVSVCGPLGCPAVRLGADVAVSLLGDVGIVGVSRDADPALVSALVSAVVADEEVLPRAQARLAAWHRASDAAQVAAAYLACHPRVRAVAYPGLPTSEDHQVAATSLVSGFGPYVDYATGTEEMCWHRIDASGHEGVPLVERLERELIR